ncbi:tyrosine- kinase Btk29A isoform X3 [Brachionus plicatilis]|uniref:Tyrosine-kinase Btk29A isoform X3 n=1 Tax=Brachionus plicatilis TaxID=10195 RepID=A0A3M7QI52_BRAPC|nr:tyrosine- kinase Btk29A isoform X3 [Brachionus plicatilis]
MKPGSKEDEMNFNREAEFMMKLQNLQITQHQNLMQLYGLSKDFDDSILIVTEFVRFGSLHNYLQKNKERIINSKNRFIRFINMCIDVCDGMEYLESHNIIHRDLATRNCLVGEGEVIKVADYGLARFTDDCYIAHPQSQFPVKWSAPEVIKYRNYSSKSDVWSFSCLMYEVFTLGKMPYGGSTANSVAAKQIISGIIPEKPTFCSNNLYENVIARAWNKNPKDRPSFKELLKLLENFT